MPLSSNARRLILKVKNVSTTYARALKSNYQRNTMSTAATTHWKLPFCITLHLDDVFGAVVWGEYGFEFDFRGGEDKRKIFM